MDGRAELMNAASLRDFTRIRELGWLEILKALEDWWPGRFDLSDLVPYTDVLGDVEPAAINQALRELRAAQWRPVPTELYRELKGIVARADAKRALTNARDRRDERPDQTDMALGRVRQLLDEGQQACSCMPRPTSWYIEGLNGRRLTSDDIEDFRRGQGRQLPEHVIRCRKCDGIDVGQVFQALAAVGAE